MQYDLTKPNTGRMIDYWLGGSHNFEIDRQFADQVVQRFPLARDLSRDERNRIKNFVPYFHERGIRSIIDLGSGLPTCDNTHLVAHEIDRTIRIVYCDIDPITVAYGNELLQGKSNVIYLQGDAVDPLTILNAPATHALLGDERRVGINFLNLTHLLMDDQLRRSWQALWEWAAPGSYMAVTVPSEVWDTVPYLAQITQSYRRSGIISYYRTREQLLALASPWRITQEGIRDGLRYAIPNSITDPTMVVTYSMMLYKD